MDDQVLASWKDGPAKQAIVDFVSSTTREGPAFVPAADRIATFDNDGTLWVEQPLPPQFDFVFGKWADEIRADPSLAARQPYKALVEKDEAFFEGAATQDPQVVATLQEGFARSWAGTTPDEFDAQVREWLQTARQPKLGLRYDALVYKPMLELFALLAGHDFRVFVCSGGGRDFMRVFAEETWGILKENVIGSAAEYRYTDGKIVRDAQMLGSLDMGPGKPEHIFAQTGRLPVFAGGNADLDIEMLDAAAFALLVNHDDDEREFAYTKGAERSLAQAKELGWTVVSMKHDWTTIFGKAEAGSRMSELTAIDTLIDPDDAAIKRAHEWNARMRESVPDGFELDATHQPHITTLQRYVHTAELDHACEAVEQTLADTDVAALSYRAMAIRHADWGIAGQGYAALLEILATTRRPGSGFAGPCSSATATSAGSEGRAAAITRQASITSSRPRRRRSCSGSHRTLPPPAGVATTATVLASRLRTRGKGSRCSRRSSGDRTPRSRGSRSGSLATRAASVSDCRRRRGSTRYRPPSPAQGPSFPARTPGSSA
jgi:phosphoglycolate phosphatase-like HAD superfamily hydrolase